MSLPSNYDNNNHSLDLSNQFSSNLSQRLIQVQNFLLTFRINHIFNNIIISLSLSLSFRSNRCFIFKRNSIAQTCFEIVLIERSITESHFQCLDAARYKTTAQFSRDSFSREPKGLINGNWRWKVYD